MNTSPVDAPAGAPVRRSAAEALGALLALPGLLAACGVRAGDHSITIVFGQEQAERTIHAALPLESDEALDLASPYGSIEVTVVPEGSEPSLRADLAVTAEDQATAQAAVDLLALAFEHRDGALVARLDERAARDAGHRFDARVSWVAQVPAGTALTASSECGGIEVHGILGACSLSSDYGSIDVSGIRGAAVVHSESGSLTLGDISAGPISATTGYGSIDARDLEGPSIRLGTESGLVSAERCRAERIEVASGYGALALSELQGTLVAGTDSGSIELVASSGATAALRSDYGAIDVRGWSGALDARSASGHVATLDVHGAVRVESGYGSIEVRGQLQGLDARTSSGSVEIDTLPGSRVITPWSVSSDYGSIELAVDPDLDFALDAATDYGSVDCEAPLAGRAAGEGTLRGSHNGGGPTVTLRTDSGSIRVARAREL